MFPVVSNDYAAANARLAGIVRTYLRELIGFAAVNTARDAGRAATIVRRVVEDYGFHGLKVRGLDSFPSREVCEAARRYDIPVLVDVVQQVAAVSGLPQQWYTCRQQE